MASKKNEFRFPVSTQIGSSFNNIVKVSADKAIHDSYKMRYVWTKFIARILDGFRILEERHYNRKIESFKIKEPPVFIIGFWRSGTTVLHNLMCQNPDFGFINTFQAIFPNDCFMNQWWLKRIARIVMPKTRPGDNMELDFSYPQEEEIALGNMQHLSFYNFFYYPNEVDSIAEKSLFYKGVSDEEIEEWKKAYLRLAKIALVNTKGEQLVSKNPPNTFRIKLLLEMFPDAKFIYIHRNSYHTIYSFQRFIEAVHDGIKYQDFEKETHRAKMIHLYKSMLEKYDVDKNLIPKENLVDIKFEYFENNMMSEMERVFTTLKLPDFEKTEPFISAYHDGIKDYQRRTHDMPKEFIKQVNDILGDLVEL